MRFSKDSLITLWFCQMLFSWQLPSFAQTTDPDLLQSAKELFFARDYESAEELLRLSLNKEDRGSVRYITSLQNLALVEYLNFHFLEAESLYQQAISMTESRFGMDSLPVANNLYGLSRCLRRENKLTEAEQCLTRLFDIRSKQLGSEHRLVSNTLFDLAVNYDRQGKYDKAEPFYVKTLEIREKAQGKTSLALKPLLESYSQCLRRLHEENKAGEIEQRIKSLDPNIAPAPSAAQQDDGSGWQNIYSHP